MILTIDIGLKNMSFCIGSCTDKKDFKTYSIHLWDNYDLINNEQFCKEIQKNKLVCNKKCNVKYTNTENEIVYTCKKHSPKNTKITMFKPKLIKSYSLQELSCIIIDSMDKIYKDHSNIFDKVTKILIELQLARNPRMKFVSHILFGKLVELYKNSLVQIKFVGASKKLKAYKGPKIECKLKNAYSRRKWLAVQYTRDFLENKFNDEQREKWLPFLESKSKQNDISDTFLMFLNGLKYK